MMLPAAALAYEAAAPQLLLRAWVHEAMRTVADCSKDHNTTDTVTRQASALHLTCNFFMLMPDRLYAVSADVVLCGVDNAGADDIQQAPWQHLCEHCS